MLSYKRGRELPSTQHVCPQLLSFIVMNYAATAYLTRSCLTGNLACDAVGGGRIIFYDFGMMDELTVPLKRSFSNLIFGIYGNDLKEVVDSLEEMDVIRKVSD